MLQTDPRKFWKCINGNKRSTISASLNDLEMHFRNINSENVNYDNINSVVHNCHTDNNNDIFNCDITLDEIEPAV